MENKNSTLRSTFTLGDCGAAIGRQYSRLWGSKRNYRSDLEACIPGQTGLGPSGRDPNSPTSPGWTGSENKTVGRGVRSSTRLSGSQQTTQQPMQYSIPSPNSRGLATPGRSSRPSSSSRQMPSRPSSSKSRGSIRESHSRGTQNIGAGSNSTARRRKGYEYISANTSIIHEAVGSVASYQLDNSRYGKEDCGARQEIHGTEADAVRRLGERLQEIQEEELWERLGVELREGLEERPCARIGSKRVVSRHPRHPDPTPPRDYGPLTSRYSSPPPLYGTPAPSYSPPPLYGAPYEVRPPRFEDIRRSEFSRSGSVVSVRGNQHNTAIVSHADADSRRQTAASRLLGVSPAPLLDQSMIQALISIHQENPFFLLIHHAKGGPILLVHQKGGKVIVILMDHRRDLVLPLQEMVELAIHSIDVIRDIYHSRFNNIAAQNGLYASATDLPIHRHNCSDIQGTRVPQTPQCAPPSPHHSPRRNQRSSSRSIQSNENRRPSTSTRAESVVSSSRSHHTTSNVNRTNRNPRVVVLQGRSSRNELRSSYTSSSMDEPHSSIPRFSIVERPGKKSTMGFHSILTLLTPGDPRSRLPRPRREENGRGPSQRAPPFSLPLYEAPPPAYESLSTASARPKGVLSKSDSHRATVRANSGGLVAPSGPSSRPQSSRSLQNERPRTSYTPKVDHRFSQASAEEARRSSRTSEESHRFSTSEPGSSHELTKDKRRSTTGIRSEDTSRRQTCYESTNVYNQPSGTFHRQQTAASRVPRSSEQARVTTGFKTYDEWCTRSK
ncbi:hypothetical protein BCON_0015g00330 [Botryotinia convoluta]|uniref:Uncharacterized protein n=1 Tax=Botryotinia convoluta TaxID=54673 RepID=A0A4Z1IR10_9HELO|nr:hypothetical protein BCON_0015g00330 [Botryotinia convoluta]